jgi:hypothetical protein
VAVDHGATHIQSVMSVFLLTTVLSVSVAAQLNIQCLLRWWRYARTQKTVVVVGGRLQTGCWEVGAVSGFATSPSAPFSAKH